ncbi:glycosyl transferase, partial [Pseudomonas aeruginosa]
MLSLLGGGGVALLGFRDDHGHVAARWRLLGLFMAALVSLFLLAGVTPFKLLGYQWDLGLVGVVLFAFYRVWLLYLYNFM